MGCCFVLARFFVWMGLFRAGSSGEWGQVITLRQLSEDAQKYIYRGKREKKGKLLLHGYFLFFVSISSVISFCVLYKRVI
jgi:hypothetical protein